MKSRQLLLAGGLGLLALAGTASAQQGPYVSSRMYVVIKFNADRQPWDYATQIGSFASMPLIGVSPSTNTAFYTVPNETDLANAPVAVKQQNPILKQFPGVVESYNYGANYPLPGDVQATRPTQTDNRYGNNATGNQSGRNRRYAPFRLNNRDKLTIQEWADQNRTVAPRIQVGSTLDQSLLGQAREAPTELVRRLPVAPSDHRFLLVGDNLVVVDGRNLVVDFAEFER